MISYTKQLEKMTFKRLKVSLKSLDIKAKNCDPSTIGLYHFHRISLIFPQKYKALKTDYFSSF